MRISFGSAGWLRYEEGDVVAYLRYLPNTRGRWVLREAVVDGHATDGVTHQLLNDLPLVKIEGHVNANGPVTNPFLQLSAAGAPKGRAESNILVLASYFRTTFGATNPARNWVAAAFHSTRSAEERTAMYTDEDRALVEQAGLIDEDEDRLRLAARNRAISLLEKVDLARAPRALSEPDDSYHLSVKDLPGRDGLTDEFLKRVARAYSAAVVRGEAPNQAVARDINHGTSRTVERWVGEARKRGILPPARKGSRG